MSVLQHTLWSLVKNIARGLARFRAKAQVERHVQRCAPIQSLLFTSKKRDLDYSFLKRRWQRLSRSRYPLSFLLLKFKKEIGMGQRSRVNVAVLIETVCRSSTMKNTETILNKIIVRKTTNCFLSEAWMLFLFVRRKTENKKLEKTTKCKISSCHQFIIYRINSSIITLLWFSFACFQFLHRLSNVCVWAFKKL